MLADVQTGPRYASLSALARVFAVLVLAGPVAISQDYASIVSAFLLAAVWLGGTLVDSLPRIPAMPALVVETCLTTFLIAWILGQSTVLVPALAIPLLLGGLARRARGVLEVLGAEMAILIATIVPNSTIDWDRELGGLLFLWLMVGIGFGLVAIAAQRSRLESVASNTSYRDARALINRLLDLSGELVEGLDPVSIAHNVVDLAAEEMPITGSMLHVRSGAVVTPLLADEQEVDPQRLAVINRTFDDSSPVVEGSWVALPLSTEAGTVAVLSARWENLAILGHQSAHETLDTVSRQLRPESLQLDTALLFSAVSHQATSEERRRLARDLHDGVAQDLASLGYLVDDLAEAADAESVRQGCRELRAELTKVIAELRRSIFSLRNEGDAASTLGERIRSMAQHIETRTGIRVTVNLDEGSEQLRPDVEAELLRIAQEAMNNAVKHARATRITVSCSVHAPSAEVVVHDDGRGLQGGRDDSHGLRIMRERARRIGASLELGNADGAPGTVLRVVLGDRIRTAEAGIRLEGLATP